MFKYSLLTSQKYVDLTQNCKILEQDGYGPKVLSLTNGNILKLFRRKKIISSALFYPYSSKFANNAENLIKLNINTVAIKYLFKIPHIKRTGVEYIPIAGKSIRDLIKDNKVTNEILAELANYFCLLHNKGIFFRSCHFGNIIYTPNNDFGLIDISDMKIKSKGLSKWHRVRNFHHIFKYQEDKDVVLKYTIDNFVENYIRQYNLFTYNELKQIIKGIIT